MNNMTDHIREEVRVAMVRQHMTQTVLADKVGLSRQHVNHMLTGHRGKLPDAWQAMLDALGLELTVQRKQQPDA